MTVTEHESRAVVARRLGVTPRTLKRWAVAGRGPRAYKLGPRTVRYRRSEVDAWLESRARESA